MESPSYISEKLFTQIAAIRESGIINMFDLKGVQHEANRRMLFDLVIFLEDYPKAYVSFLLMGERSGEPQNKEQQP